MAIFQPTNIIPSTFAGAGLGTVAPSQEVNISWQVNGDEPLKGYAISIFPNTSDTTAVFTTGMVTLSIPFYPTDENGAPQRFTYRNAGTTWGEIGVVAGNEYKIVITQYSASPSVTQYSPSVFQVRALPTLSINTFTNPLQSVSQTFTAAYSQAQADGINWARWVLTNNGTVIADTGEISTSLLRFAYDGFMNQQTYTIALTVETQSGVQVQTQETFNVDYTAIQTAGFINVSCENGGAFVEWGKPFSADGTPTPSTNYGTISDGVLTLTELSSVRWDNVNGSAMDFTAPYSVAWKGSPNPTLSEYTPFILLYLGSNLYVRYSAPVNNVTSVEVYFEGSSIGGVTLDYRVDMKDIIFTLNSNGAFTVHYTVGDSTNWYTYSVDLPLDLPPSINFVEISSDSTADNRLMCDYIFISSNADYDYSNILNQKPQWDSSTLFYADFENGLSAGTIVEDNDEGDTGMVFTAVYRKKGNVLLPLGAWGDDPRITSLTDFSTNNYEPYSYLLFYRINGQYSASVESAQKCFTRQYYSLVEATPSVQTSNNDMATPNVYNVINTWAFGANVEAGSIGNNNTPTFLQNFTKYPFRQPSTPAPKSGVLQGLLSNVVGGDYNDTAAQMEALYNISQSQNSFFLLDMKGNMYMVHTSGAITQTINTKSGKQEVTVSIPWQEIGDCDGVALIQTND